MSLVRFDRATVTYSGAPAPTLRNVSFAIDDGEFVLVTGATGAGKSTLLRTMCGLVPHFTGGRLEGSVEIAGRATATHPPRELADLVGYVGQDPVSTFVADLVDDELGYTMENLGLPPDVMRRRVEETVDLLGIHHLRGRSLRALSGGEQQRVAIAAVLCASPRVLILDEPTSSLDPGAAEDVLSVLDRLVHDVGLTVVLAEHRLERVVHLAERVLRVTPGGTVVDRDAERAFDDAELVPPVIRLGQRMGWHPTPRSVRDARRRARPTREALGDLGPSAGPDRRPTHPAGPGTGDGPGLVSCDTLGFSYAQRTVMRDVSCTFPAGQLCALMGRNGAGKSTLLAQLAGALRPMSGTVRVAGRDPAALDPPERIGVVGLVPQDPTDLLYASSVADECAGNDADTRCPAGTTASILASFDPGIDATTHPRDLSVGQQLLVALAVVLAPDPAVLLLDEPTRGLDYPAKAHLGDLLAARCRAGSTVIVATHDVELTAEIADRVVVLADGDVIADGETHDVLCHSATLAPQLARVFSPVPLLTLEDLDAALTALPSDAEVPR